MNAKEKAKEMYDKMLNSDIMNMTKYCAKQCALIAVDEILNHHSQEQGLYRIDTYYWQQVKSELHSF
jgi:hypothetical protein